MKYDPQQAEHSQQRATPRIILSKETSNHGHREVSQKNNSKQLNGIGVKRKKGD